jgi:hypothetical protein
MLFNIWAGNHDTYLNPTSLHPPLAFIKLLWTAVTHDTTRVLQIFATPSYHWICRNVVENLHHLSYTKLKIQVWWQLRQNHYNANSSTGKCSDAAWLCRNCVVVKLQRNCLAGDVGFQRWVCVIVAIICKRGLRVERFHFSSHFYPH